MLKPIGYTIGGGWEYDRGFFDYKISDQDGYLFLRIPVEANKGHLDERCRYNRHTLLLRHVYQQETDDHAGGGVLSHYSTNSPSRNGGMRQLTAHIQISASRL